jgi:AbiV family abortive infection protein
MTQDERVEPRKLVRLMDLSASDRLPRVAEGLELLAHHVDSKIADATLLFEASRYTSAHLLDGFASEEAAKALMLLDAIRAQWKPDADVRWLMNKSFYDHHSRLMYVHIYDFPAHLDRDEIKEFVDGQRDSYFVDGPEGFEWVFRNAELAKREGRMYVDYCVNADGRAEWDSPDKWGWKPFVVAAPSGAVKLVQSLARIGILSTAGLNAIQDAWRGAPIDIGWQEVRERNWTTIKILDEAGGIQEATKTDVTRAVNHWQMPLLGIELTERKMTLAQARAQQDALWEAFQSHEYGDPYW